MSQFESSWKTFDEMSNYELSAVSDPFDLDKPQEYEHTQKISLPRESELSLKYSQPSQSPIVR